MADSSETAHTLAACDHLDSIRTTIPTYCCLNATRERRQGFTQTTTKGDDYNYHKAKLQLSPRETHWQTLLHALVYTTISFLCTLYSYFLTPPLTSSMTGAPHCPTSLGLFSSIPSHMSSNIQRGLPDPPLVLQWLQLYAEGIERH